MSQGVARKRELIKKPNAAPRSLKKLSKNTSIRVRTKVVEKEETKLLSHPSKSNKGSSHTHTTPGLHVRTLATVPALSHYIRTLVTVPALKVII